MAQFWCPLCKSIIAIRYEFYRNRQKEICARIKSRVEPVGMALIHGDEDDDKSKKN
jgi:hypothetical protein